MVVVEAATKPTRPNGSPEEHLPLPEHVTELDHAAPPSNARVRRALYESRCMSRAFRAVREVTILADRYPKPIDGAFNVGLLHTSVTGRPGHDDYAPCTVETLVGRGYDYFALGHVHRREVLSERPFIVFPGNLQRAITQRRRDQPKESRDW